ncbi:MAG: hypothetical protein IT222_12165 [Crocinitomix sp.]|nr:hypothetical protein [Crocinitomix sp.]
MMKNNHTTQLASNCLYVKGFKKNLIIDFQNDEWYHVDFNLFPKEDLELSALNEEEIKHLIERQIIITIPSTLKNNFPAFLSDFDVPSIIEFAIIDRNAT